MVRQFPAFNKYRNATGTPAKREVWFQELQLSTTFSEASNGIKATLSHYVVKRGDGGSSRLSLLPLDQPGRGIDHCLDLPGHAGTLTDWDVSPFYPQIIGAGSDSGVIQLWSANNANKFDPSQSPTTFQAHAQPVQRVLFHPVCRQLMATMVAGSEIKLWDTQSVGRDASEPVWQSPSSDAGIYTDGCWHGDGSLLLAIHKHTTLHLFDPRAAGSSDISGQTTAQGGGKLSRVIWVGEKPMFVTTGLSKMRMGEMAIWDARNMQTPIHIMALDAASGVPMPHYDPDTGIVYVVTRGGTKARWFHIDEAKRDTFIEFGSLILPAQSNGATLVPKSSLNVMHCEIARLAVLGKPTTGAASPVVVPLSFQVPRRSYLDFYPELFPDTKGDKCSVTAEDWFQGMDEPVARVSLDPARKASRSKPAATLGTKAPASLSPKPTEPPAVPVSPLKPSTPKPNASLVPAKPSQPESGPQVSQQPSTSTPKSTTGTNEPVVTNPPSAALAQASKPKLVLKAGPRFKYLEGKTYHPSQHFEHIPPVSLSLPAEIQLLHASATFLAYPVQGPGGQIAVMRRDHPGRCPTDDNAPLFATQAAVTLLQFDPFDSNCLLTAHTDREVRFWQLPAEGVAKTTTLTPVDQVVIPGDKLIQLAFQGQVQHLWAVVVSVAFNESEVLLMNRATVVKSMAHLKEAIHHVAWSHDGTKLAVATKQKKLRIYNAQTDQVLQVGPSHESARVSKTFWTHDDQYLGSVGFGLGSQRELLLYDPQNLASGPVSRKIIDTSPSVLTPYYDPDCDLLYLQDRGSSHIHCYELHEKAFAELPHFEGGKPQQSVAFLSKPFSNVAKVEVQRAYRLTLDAVESIGFFVPRKRVEYFQDDVFPATRGLHPTKLGVDDWFKGQSATPDYLNLCPKGMIKLSDAPPEKPKKVAHTVQEQMVSEETTRQNFLETMFSKARIVAQGSSSDTEDTHHQKQPSADEEHEVSESEWDA
ncbi:hypothetical protein H4R34_000421 [Dimargaris verticillata]|uniref:DUF1899 domain-containing protein n=1 Tax=Dimargaris verticillata TaxID=2761393 RepID=A0A9W8B6P7_9FUNG|nr:hypothetical protein H4R34_000421 [Dimargaris verticillata]